MKTFSGSLRLLVAAAVLGSLFAWTAPAQAHFIWVVADSDDTGTRLQLCFGEGPQPAEAYLLDNVAQSKLWVVSTDGARTLVKLAKQSQGDEGAWVATVEAPPLALEAVCNYGVFSRGGKANLLNYYARYLKLSSAAPAPATDLQLAVVPTAEEGAIRLRVLWQDKVTAEGVEIVAAGPGGKSLEAKRDGDSFVLPIVGSGRYVIRARLAQDTKGKLGDESYDRVLNYSTLTLDVSQ